MRTSLAILALLLSGCFDVPRLPEIPKPTPDLRGYSAGPAEAPPTATADASTKRVAELEQEAARISGELAAERTRGRQLAAQERQAQGSRLLLWVAGLAGFGMVLCTAGAIFLPFLRGQAIVGIFVCIGLLIAALAARELLPYLLPIAIGGGVISAIAAILWMRRQHAVIGDIAEKIGPGVRGLSERAVDHLVKHHWKA